MSSFLSTIVRGTRIIENADPDINYEGLGLPKPSPDKEDIEIGVSIRKDSILFVRDSNVEFKNSCVIGTDYGLEYISLEPYATIISRL